MGDQVQETKEQVAKEPCQYDPRELIGQPIGMFHCPLCLEVVVAGLPHPEWHKLDEFISNDVDLFRGEGVTECGDGPERLHERAEDRSVVGIGPIPPGDPPNTNDERQHQLDCRKCGKNANETGGYLKRINPLGEIGIWECYPSCDAEVSFETKVLLALEIDDDR